MTFLAALRKFFTNEQMTIFSILEVETNKPFSAMHFKVEENVIVCLRKN